MDAAVDLILKEKTAFTARHRTLADKVRQTLRMGSFEIFPEEDGASDTVTAFLIPDGLEDEAFRKHLWNHYGVMIAGSWASLSGKVWRIGHMGENCRDEKLYRTFRALDQALTDFKCKPPRPLAGIYTSF